MRENFDGIFGGANESNRDASGGDTDRQRVYYFLNNFGWEYNVDICCENENIKTDELYENWSVIRFLNKISYMQAKAAFEKAVNGIK